MSSALQSLPEDCLRLAAASSLEPAASQPILRELNTPSSLNHPSLLGPIIKNTPNSARQHCAPQLSSVLDNIVFNPNELLAWSRILNLGNTMLLVLPCCDKKHNLTSILKKRSALDKLAITAVKARNMKTKNELTLLAGLVTSKIKEDNVKAALRLLSSEDKPAMNNEATVNALRAKHPITPIDRRLTTAHQD